MRRNVATEYAFIFKDLTRKLSSKGNSVKGGKDTRIKVHFTEPKTVTMVLRTNGVHLL